MPCGSVDCTSTRHIKAIPPAFPDFGLFWQIPLSWLSGMAAWIERRSRYRNFANLMTGSSPTSAYRGTRSAKILSGPLACA